MGPSIIEMVIMGSEKVKINFVSGPDGAKDLSTILTGPDRQGGSECL